MSTTINKAARVNEVAALQQLVDGLTQNAATAPSVVLAGVTLKPGDIVAKIQARLAVAKAVAAAAATWHSAVQTDKAAAEQLKPLVATVKQTLIAAFSTQLVVLAEFGLTPRKKPVVSPATRTAAALKAKATRAARGTTGKVQKAAITAPVTITPATATPIKSPAATPLATAPSNAPSTPASPPAGPAHS
jgi:hypothetical protein